jgi:hypothetical protein
MRLAIAQIIAQKATYLLAHPSGNRPHVYRLSDLGVTSVKTLIEAILLEMADQYQIQISTGHKTVADFKQVAELYGGISGHFVFGGVLPDDVYDRLVRENPDPKKLFHALISAGHSIDWPDALQTETDLSFYEFLTSLDPSTLSYWPQVYKRLNLPFDSSSVPPSRINFRPENGLTVSRQLPASWAGEPKVPLARQAVQKPSKRGILISLFEKAILNTPIVLSRDAATYLSEICRSSMTKCYDQARKGIDPALFVSTVASTCQRWHEDIRRVLDENVSPEITVKVRKQDLNYILPALNAEADEFDFRATESTDPQTAKNFSAHRDFCRYLIQNLRLQVPQTSKK